MNACVKCDYYKKIKETGYERSYRPTIEVCTHPKSTTVFTNPISGRTKNNYLECIDMRTGFSEEGECGIEGKLFVPKVVKESLFTRFINYLRGVN